MTDWDETSLRAALEEALEEKEKAAEYGLQLLHRNTILEQSKYNIETQLSQLKTNHDELKLTHTELSSSHTKLNKSLESHDQSLLSESEDREISLMDERDQLRDTVKRLQKIEKKNKVRLGELTAQVEYLNDEVDKHKMVQRTNNEQIRALRAKGKNYEKDYSDMADEIFQLQKDLGTLRQSETRTEGLIEMNMSLKENNEKQQNELQQFHSFFKEKEFEQQQLTAALEHEREEKRICQIKLEESLRSDNSFSDDNSDIPTRMMSSPNQIHSPPMSSVAHELVSDLRDEIQISVNDLELKLENMSDEKTKLICDVEKHKQDLLSSQSEISKRDEEMNLMRLKIEKSVRELSEKDEIEQRFYTIQESHQNMINDLSTDIIKLKRTNKCLKTQEFLGHETIMQQKQDIDKMQKMYFESNSAGLIRDMQHEIYILRDRERVLLQTITNLKSDLSKENEDKLTALYIELHTLFRDLCILKKFSVQYHQKDSESPDTPDIIEDEDWLIGQNISADKVVALLKEQVGQLKTTINKILMRQICTSGLSSDDIAHWKQLVLQNNNQKSVAEIKSQYEKDISSLREGNTEMKYKNRQLEREKLEWESLRKVFDMKCEEYIVEVDINEKRLRESERERKTLGELLTKIINDKIELKQKIETFEMNLEKNWSLPTSNSSLFAQFEPSQIDPISSDNGS